ncbi:cysteine-rich CWC family protein [Marinobacterium stanieri]|uniref:cysteine-rich CWC family protein n=1 Tax=Marinobacterium stanieri TaxID=49186 RepID=UPI000255A927|nr:cysteine-rich CWC family protein [Marinobacterium stanieri]
MKTDQTANVDPLKCPLCGQGNACLNLGAEDVSRTCWCNDPDIRFPAELLAQIPPEQRRKACICRACALAYQQQQTKPEEGL